jgi:RHS repeat-associated protein
MYSIFQCRSWRRNAELQSQNKRPLSPGAGPWISMAGLAGLLCVGSLESQTLTNGALYLGTITAFGTNSLTLSASTGESLVVRVGMLSSSGFFDPWLRLYGPDGQLVGSADSGTGSAAEIAITATNSGTFTVLVSDGGYGGYGGNGTYRLSYLKVPGAFVVSPGEQGGAIVNGTLNPGTISAGGLQAWSLGANNGESLVVRVGMLSSSGFFDPWLRLYGPDGQLIGSVDSGAGSAAEIAITATNSGTFTVLVSDGVYGGLGGTGTYQLTCLKVPGTFVVSPGEEGGAITNGTLNPGTISAGGLQAWSLGANSGDSLVVRVGMLSSSGFFDPWLRLYGPDGQLVGSLDSGSGSAAEIAITTTNSGTFTVLVSDGGYGGYGGTGTYQLNYLKVPGAFVVSPGQQGGSIINGALNFGTISTGDVQAWSLGANSGESVVVRVGMLSSSGFFDPWLRLYGPGGQLIGSVDSGSGSAAELAITATNSGTFTVLVSDGGYGGLGGTGTYQLSCLKVPGAFVVSPGEQGGAITNGTLNPGTISAGDLQAWSLGANSGDSLVVRVGMLTSSGFFDPWLRLYGPDGQLVGSVDSGSGSAAEIAITATNSGTFTVLVSDGGYSGLGGTGTYQLTCFKVPGAFVVSAGDEGGVLAENSANPGVISIGDLDPWSFTAAAGDFVSLVPTSSNFTPGLRFYSPDGRLLASSASSLRYFITNTGGFTVLVGGASLTGVGTYNLQFSHVPSSIVLTNGDPNGFGGWSTDGGVWEFGVPTAVDGPAQAHSPPTCAGTVLSGDYPNLADAHLISPLYLVPPLSENPRFKFWQWYLTASAADYGQLQIRTNGGAWTNISEQITGVSTNWSERFLDLRPYAGQTVQIAFHFVSANGSTAPGWYVDDVSFESGPMTFNNPESFEAGLGDWNSDNYRVWQIGVPFSGPPLNNGSRAHFGTNVAATGLNGNYLSGSTGRLISPVLNLPVAAADSALLLRLWQWYQYGTGGSGQVQLSEWTGTNWGSWATIATAATNGTSTNWSQLVVDLTSYQGRQVQLGFLHTANSGGSVGPGWFLDDIGISTFVPTALPLGSGVTNQFTSNGDRAYYVVQFPGTGHLQITLNSLNGLGINELYLRRGGLPSAGLYDYRFSNLSGANQSILVSDAGAGPWYILAYGNTVVGSGFYNLSASLLTGLVLSDLSPNRAGNVLPATIAVDGAGFDSTAQAYLQSGGTIVATAAVTVVSSSRLQATFNFVGVPGGAYNVTIVDGTNSASLPFQVVNGGIGKLDTQLIVPGAVGRHVPSVLYVEYANVGDGPMAAPLLVVHGSQRSLMTLDPTLGAQGFWTASKVPGFSDTLQILASGATPGVLQAGERIRVPIMHCGLEQPWDFTAPGVEFDLGVFDSSSTDLINWNTLITGSQISTNLVIPNAVWSNLVANVGASWGDYTARLSADARYLGTLGLNVTAVSDLLGFEFAQADGLSPLAKLCSATDASVSAPGLDLVFARIFPERLSHRNQLGALGWGWSHNWAYFLNQDTNGNVTIQIPAGGARVFQRDVRGGFFNQPGDHGVLTSLGAGRWQLTETDGNQFVFRSDGLLDYVQDLNGNRISATYSGGLLTTLSHSSGQSIQFTYAGRLIQSVTDAYGRVATYGYDGSQHLTSATSYNTNTVKYSYVTGQGIAVEHALASVTYPGGIQDLFSYDPQGRLAAIRGPGGAEPLTFSYDAIGKVVATDGQANATTFFFDQRGLIARAVDPLGHAAQFTLDKNLNLTAVTGPGKEASTLTYDALGNATRRVDAMGNAVTLKYSAYSRLAKLTDGLNQTSSFSYDSQGNVTGITFPDGSAESLAHDQHGELASIRNRRGQITLMKRDASGRIIRKITAEGRTNDFTYDAHGNLSGIVDSLLGTTTLTYDERDLLSSLTYPDGKGFTFQHDLAGRRISRTSLDGYTLKYFYDTLGRLEHLEDGTGRQIIRYTYDTVGRLAREDKGNGTGTSYDYDAASRIARLTNFGTNGAILSRFDYTYDPDGNQSSIATLSGSDSFTYDAVGQLTAASYANGRSVTYAYDAAGNRTVVNDNGTNQLYSANNLNEYSVAGDASLGYDADGNLTNRTDSSGTTSFQYDSENRLIAVVTPTNGTWQYTYDAFGNRISSTHAGQTVSFLNDPIKRVDRVAEYKGDGTLIAHYDYGFGLVCRTDGNGSNGYYDFDGNGSTREITDGQGSVENTYDYDAFGAVVQAHELLPNPFGFSGHFGVFSDGSGTVYMRARAYAPALGRFLQIDPSGLRASASTLGYAYAGNNPMGRVDPMGADFEPATDDPYQPTPPDLGKSIIEGSGEVTHTLLEAAHLDTIGTKVLGGFNNVLGYHTAYEYYEKGDRNRAYYEATKATFKLIPGLFAPELKGFTFLQGLGISAAVWRISDLWGQFFDWGTYGIGKIIFWGWEAYDTLSDPFFWKDLKKSISKLVGAHDPNGLIGPAGYGTANYLGTNVTFAYQINFENASNATAPAQVVVITNAIPSDLDLSTLQISGIGFGDHFLSIPAGSQHYEHTEHLIFNDTAFDVNIEASVDYATRQVRVTFDSIVPLTGLPPSVDVGFLPPEDGTGRGDGYLAYTIRPVSGLSTGTEIRNTGAVSFDPLAGGPVFVTDLLDPTNPNSGIDTNRQALVTLDITPPVSAVNGPSGVATTPSFAVTWSGTDLGSGIESFDIYVSTNHGPWSLWLASTTNNLASFNGQPSSSYGFFSIAHDLSGNTELIKSVADVTVTVASATTPVFQSITRTDSTVSLTWSSINGRVYQLQSKDEMISGTWSNVGSQAMATGSSITLSDSQSPVNQRFYRVILLP